MKLMQRGFSHCILACLMVMSSQGLMAADHARSASEIWKAQIADLSGKMDSDSATATVFSDLEKWSPARASSLWKPIMWLRDTYLYNDDFRGQVRANGEVRLYKRFYELFTGRSIDFPLDDLVRSIEGGTILLRNLHDLPYAWYRPANASGPFSVTGLTRSACSFLGHMSALASNMIGSTTYCLDPIASTGSFCAATALDALSYGLMGLSGWLAMEGDYIDVALRSLERGYRKRNMGGELQAVRQMIAQRTTVLNRGRHERV